LRSFLMKRAESLWTRRIGTHVKRLAPSSMSCVTVSLVLDTSPYSTSPMMPNRWSTSTPRPMSTLTVATADGNDNDKTTIATTAAAAVIALRVRRFIADGNVSRSRRPRPDRVHVRDGLAALGTRTKQQAVVACVYF